MRKFNGTDPEIIHDHSAQFVRIRFHRDGAEG